MTIVRAQPIAVKEHGEKLFGIVLLEWLDTQALRHKPSTQMKYRNLINRHITPALGDLPLTHMTAARLTGYLQMKSAHGRLGW